MLLCVSVIILFDEKKAERKKEGAKKVVHFL
jgi:hypothetical protein